MARPQKFRHSREALADPQIAAKLGAFVLDIEGLRAKRKQIDLQIAAGYDAVDDAGFEKKFVRKVIALRAKEESVRLDEEEGLEAYEFAVEKGVPLACARRKGDLPAHNPFTGELQDEPETERNEPEAAAEVAGDYLREPVAAGQGQIIREGDAPRETDRDYSGDASRPDTELQMDRATEGSFETGSEAAEKGREAIPAGPEGADLSHAGADESSAADGQDVEATVEQRPSATNHQSTGVLPAGGSSPSASEIDEIAEPAQPSPPKQAELSKAGEGVPPLSPANLSDEEVVPAFLRKEYVRKTARDYRPHCRHPEECASSELDHCYQCRKALAAAEMETA